MAHPYCDRRLHNPYYDKYINENAEDKYQTMHDKIAEDGKKLLVDFQEFLLARGVDAIRFDSDIEGLVHGASLVMYGHEVHIDGVDCFGIDVDEMLKK